MLKKFSSKFLMVVGLLLTKPVLAEGDHAHAKGSHGGEVKGLGSKYHIEGVREKDKATFFILDAEGKNTVSISKHGGGTVTVIAPGKPQDKSEIKADSPLAETKVSVPADGKVTVLISVKVDDKPVTAKFNFN